MILELEPMRDTETPSHTHNERICETTPEETSRSVLLGAAENQATGDPERPAGRPEGIHPRSTRTRSGRPRRRGCASWPGSSPVPTWSGRFTERQAMSRHGPALAYCQRRGLRGEHGAGERGCLRRRPWRRQRGYETVPSNWPQTYGGKQYGIAVPIAMWKKEAKRFSRSASGDIGTVVHGLVPVPVCHLLGNGENTYVLVHRIEPVAGGALLDPGSASRSGRALIPRWAIAGRAGLDP